MKKSKFKLSLKHYMKPTPSMWRRLGDSLLAVSVFIGGSAYALDYHWIAIAGFSLAIIGKFLTNFFAVEDE